MTDPGANTTGPPPSCPRCRRPVAVARPRCLYCGAELPAESVRVRVTPEAEVPAIEPAPPSSGVLLILDLEGADIGLVARALDIGVYEAGQRVRRGGYQLLQVVDAGAADEAALQLSGHGLPPTLVPEAEAREATRPVTARGGRLDGDALLLRLPGGERRVRAADLLIVVRGPIARERAGPRPQVRWGLFQAGGNLGLPGLEWGTATLEPGYRFHLHLKTDRCPLEIDPMDFVFTSPHEAGQGTVQRIQAWIAAAASAVPADDAFRRLSAALAPEEGLTTVAAALSRRPGQGATTDALAVLDNVAQFRFYSGWRAAVERRLPR